MNSGGTLINFGGKMRIDVGGLQLLHLHLDFFAKAKNPILKFLGNNHLQIGRIIAGILGGI